MTRNQISFAELKETQRHNRVSEVHEHYDTRTRRQQADAATSQASSAARNAATNWWLAQETERAHRAQESESYRHNYQTEQLQSYQAMTSASAAQDQARAALQRAATERSALAETIRHNLEYEGIQSASQAEQARHNVAAESLSRYGYGVQYGIAQMQNALGYSQLAETTRHAMEQEKIGQSQAFSSAKQAHAAEQSALSSATRSSAAMISAEASSKQADAAMIKAKSEAVRTGSSLAKDIINTIGGVFR